MQFGNGQKAITSAYNKGRSYRYRPRSHKTYPASVTLRRKYEKSQVSVTSPFRPLRPYLVIAHILPNSF